MGTALIIEMGQHGRLLFKWKRIVTFASEYIEAEWRIDLSSIAIGVVPEYAGKIAQFHFSVRQA
jgi:hypothetical protein